MQDMGREKKENQGERHFMPWDWQEEGGDGWCEGEGIRSRGSLCFVHFLTSVEAKWFVNGKRGTQGNCEEHENGKFRMVVLRIGGELASQGQASS